MQHFAVGSLVLVKNMKNNHRMGGKLDSRWIGPYVVSEKLAKGQYRLKNKDGNVLQKIHSAILLRITTCKRSLVVNCK